MAHPQDPFFESIGNAVARTDLLPDRPDEDDNDDQFADVDEDRPMQAVESLCMSCGEQGITRMLLTSIPYFREVIVMSFRCDHCGFNNNEIQSAGIIRERGTLYTAKILTQKDLDRQIVKSETGIITIPEFELTIPGGKGQLTNIEGVFRDTIIDLSSDQPLRRIQDPAAYQKIDQYIARLKDIVPDDEDEDQVEGAVPRRKENPDDPLAKSFTVLLDDPAGNSFIEFIGTMSDPKWNLKEYVRSQEQNLTLGLVAPEDVTQSKAATVLAGQPAQDDDLPAEEIFVFPGVCSSCGNPVDTRMQKVVIPYFKDVFIMSTNCSLCGYRDNEVKSGGATSESGKRITLKVEDSEDLSRDILKSETCGLEIPEIDLMLHAGTLGGRFTTVEGILSQVYDELTEKVFRGDSALATAGQSDIHSSVFERFLGNLKDVMTAARPFTLILDDPLANSYVQNIYAPDPDPNMEIETYRRTHDQNEELGLNDIKVEGYEGEAEAAQAAHEQEVVEARAATKNLLGSHVV